MNAIKTLQTQIGSVDFLLPNLEAIPNELRQLPNALWFAEPELSSNGAQVIKPNGRPRIKKAPRNTAGFNISKLKPDQWLSYNAAVAAFNPERFTGIGVLLNENDGLVGIDLDDVETLFYEHPSVKRIVDEAEQAGIYCEKSPSGTGLRMFVYGNLPDNGGRRKGGIELYSHVAFLTVTGVQNWPGDIKDGQWFIDKLLDAIGSTSPKTHEVAEGQLIVDFHEVDSVLSDSLQAWTAEQHNNLWSGRWEEPTGLLGGKAYPSQSEADMALVGYLTREAFTQKCAPNLIPATVLSVFKKSGLYRADKEAQIRKYAIPKAIKSAMSGIQQKMDLGFEVRDIHGDVLYGRMFAQIWKNKFLYVTNSGKWLRWDDKSDMWVWCHMGEALDACKAVATELLRVGGKTIGQDQSEGKRLIGLGIKAHDLKRLEAMLKLAASEPEMAAVATALDSDPWLLGVQNGVVSLRSGHLLPNNPQMLITRRCNAAYDENSQCPRWLQFLDEVFGGDVDTIETVQRALGYTLTGSTTEEVLFICHGYGSNGKSVFNNVVAAIIGDYGRVAPPSMLTARRTGDTSPRNDLASIAGSRYVSINELQCGDRLDEQVVKMLAGREPISTRFLYQEHFEFTPTFTAWLRTNHKPIITGDDDGIWRRLVMIAFAKQFTGSQRDPNLEEKLLAERDGILAWMVKGALKWQQDGLRLSSTIQLDCASYRKESDLLGEFLADVCALGADHRCLQDEMYIRYENWCKCSGVKTMTKTSLTRRLAERGYIAARSNGKRYYTGIKVIGHPPLQMQLL